MTSGKRGSSSSSELSEADSCNFVGAPPCCEELAAVRPREKGGGPELRTGAGRWPAGEFGRPRSRSVSFSVPPASPLEVCAVAGGCGEANTSEDGRLLPQNHAVRRMLAQTHPTTTHSPVSANMARNIIHGAPRGRCRAAPERCQRPSNAQAALERHHPSSGAQARVHAKGGGGGAATLTLGAWGATSAHPWGTPTGRAPGARKRRNTPTEASVLGERASNRRFLLWRRSLAGPWRAPTSTTLACVCVFPNRPLSRDAPRPGSRSIALRTSATDDWRCWSRKFRRRNRAGRGRPPPNPEARLRR